MYVCMYVCMYVRTTYIYIYIHIHINVHIYILLSNSNNLFVGLLAVRDAGTISHVLLASSQRPSPSPYHAAENHTVNVWVSA